jgi:hypothetical protein
MGKKKKKATKVTQILPLPYEGLWWTLDVVDTTSSRQSVGV